MQNWYSIEWFRISKLIELSWARPFILYFLLGIPLLFFIRSIIQNRTIEGLPIATLKSKIDLGWSRHLRFLQPILIALALTFFIIALARPQLSNKTQNKFSEGIDIVLAMDISESMLTKDVLPSRLEASKNLARQFIKNRYQDRIGIVLFSGEAYSLAPLTTDYLALNEYIDEIKPKLITAEGTAIGSALAVAVNRLKEAKSTTKIIILTSDGDNTAGNIDPTTAAQIASAYGVKIYTILVGGNVRNIQRDSLSASYTASVDQKILADIAKIGNGKYFMANSSGQLKSVFEQINKLEKVKFLENSSLEMMDVYHVYLRWGIVFLLLAFATKITFIGNILED
jgi:Ca-activated chloride channel homolog